MRIKNYVNPLPALIKERDRLILAGPSPALTAVVGRIRALRERSACTAQPSPEKAARLDEERRRAQERAAKRLTDRPAKGPSNGGGKPVSSPETIAKRNRKRKARK